MKTLTLDEAVKHATDAVAEQGPDFVYADPQFDGQCAYVPTTDPHYPKSFIEPQIGADVTGCLVGETLKRADLLTSGIAGSEQSIISLIHGGMLAVESRTVLRFLAELQNAQDAGNPWGVALDEALSVIES